MRQPIPSDGPSFEPSSRVVPAPSAERQADVSLISARRSRARPSRPIVETTTAARRVIDALVEAGVDTFFGVPGGPIMPLFDALLRDGRVHLIESRQESSAAFAAAGYYRATGKAAAVVVTAGPGATNVTTGVVSAHLERVPMLIICGDVAWQSSGGTLLQSLGREGVGIEEMLQGVTRATVRATLPRSAPTQALAALAAAMNLDNPGPALLVLPIDCAARAAPDISRIERARALSSCQIDDRVVIEVGSRLARAQRPLLVLGGGCLPHANALKHLVETLEIPFVTTPRAKGLLSERHRYSLRNCGLGASWWARTYMSRGVDVALVLGTDLDDVSVGPTRPIRPDGDLIHVDRNPAVFNRNYPTRTGIVCELGAFVKRLRRLAHHLRLCNPRTEALMAEATAQSPYDVEDFRIDSAPHLAPHRAIHDLERAAGPNTTFVSDIGEHMLFALHYLTARGPDSFVIHLGLGSMTSGICSAVGFAIGSPTRRVVCICGDGGMQMAGSELLVAAKLRLPIIYAIFNDARYNMVYHGYRQQFEREASWDTPWIDFVAWGRAFGLPGARIERPGQLTAELLKELCAEKLPVILDIRHDPEVRIREAGRSEALQQMSMTPRGAS